MPKKLLCLPASPLFKGRITRELSRKAGHTASFVLEELLKRSERLLKYYRNYLEGTIGDKINALLSGCGSNIRKLIAAFFLSLKFLSRLQEKVLGYISSVRLK